MLITLTISTIPAIAQREKNFIFLFDCTGSMKTNELWEPAKASLDKNIELRTSIPGSQFAVIPFGDNAYETFSFSAEDSPKKKQEIAGAFEKYIQQAKYTNISDVLTTGFKRTDPNKLNEIYLFTDGLPNGSDSPARVAQTINAWCANHQNTKLYYVALKEGVINPIIQAAIEACPDAEIIQCKDGIIPVITDVSTDIYTNLMELGQEYLMGFDIPGNYDLRSKCNDELFSFRIVDNKAIDGKFNVIISARQNQSVEELYEAIHGQEYLFSATVEILNDNISIVNPTVRVHVLPELPVSLSIAEGTDELKADGAEWFDAFLWSDAAEDETVSWDLSPIFKNEQRSSCLGLKFQPAEGECQDYELRFNGQKIKGNDIINIVPGQPAIIEVQFNHDAQTGKRYIKLLPVYDRDIDLINDGPTDEFEGLSLRTEYDLRWNPLKTLLMWIGIILLAGLILWFVLLKRIFYPVITLSQVTITGPGTYYLSKKIKGARKVILTSKKRSQNVISRLFSGEVRYVRADHFMPELAIVAAGGKKKVRVRQEGKAKADWDFYPSAVFRQFEKGTLTNRSTGDKSEIEFN